MTKPLGDLWQWLSSISRRNGSQSVWIWNSFVCIVPPTNVLIGSVDSPITKWPFTTRATLVHFESLIHLVMWPMIQRSGTRLPPPVFPLPPPRSPYLPWRLSVTPPPPPPFSVSLLSPCTEPAKQKLNYYGWVKECDGSGLCVRVHASVHVNMSVYSHSGADWDSRDENLWRVTVDMFHTLLHVDGAQHTWLFNSQFAHVNFITAQWSHDLPWL